MGKSHPLPVRGHCRGWGTAAQWTSGLEMGVCTCLLHPCLLVSHSCAAWALSIFSSPSTLRENMWARAVGAGTVSWMPQVSRSYRHSSRDRTTLKGGGAPQEISSSPHPQSRVSCWDETTLFQASYSLVLEISKDRGHKTFLHDLLNFLMVFKAKK